MLRTLKAASLALAVLLATGNAATAADAKAASEAKRPQYKKVTGSVVSVSPTGIVIKSKTKGDVALAVTNTTDVVNGKAARPGDRARVNYRADKNGKTATRIEVLSTGGAAAPQRQAAPAAAKTSK